MYGFSFLLHIILLVPDALSDSSVVVEETAERILEKPQIVEHKCRKLDKHILRHLGTKTPYRIVANLNESPPSYEGLF